MSAVTAACPTPCPAQITARSPTAQYHTAQEAPPCVHASGPPGAAFPFIPFRGSQPPKRGTVPPTNPFLEC